MMLAMSEPTRVNDLLLHLQNFFTFFLCKYFPNINLQGPTMDGQIYPK